MRKALAVLIMACSLALPPASSRFTPASPPKMPTKWWRCSTATAFHATREIGADNTYAISVDSSVFAPTVEILNRYGYPHEQYKSVADVFKGDGLIVSPLSRRRASITQRARS